MDLKYMILVTENDRGTETNMLLTLDDYKSFIAVDDMSELADNLLQLGRTLGEADNFAEYYRAANARWWLSCADKVVRLRAKGEKWEGRGLPWEASSMKFTKMHGIGNDYVYVNCLEEELPMDAGRLAELVSDRHFGIGSDGLVLIGPSEVADFRMDIYNADGSQAMMCGNGIRCVAKYVYDHGMTNMTALKIDTLSGVKNIELTVKDGKVRLATVNMGRPVLLSHGANLERCV